MLWRLRYPVHVSWLVALVSGMFVVGVSLSPWFRVGLVVSIAVLCVVVAAFRWPQTWLVIVATVASGIVGCGYGSAVQGDRRHVDVYVGRVVTLRGTIREDPGLTASRQLSVQLQDVSIEGVAQSGYVLASVASDEATLLRGDTVTLKGELRGSFGSFVASISQARVIAIESQVPGDVGRVVRDHFADRVREGIEEPMASLGVGFLTGQKSLLSPELTEAMKTVGLTHIVVASGYNLTILVRLARRLFVKHSKYLATASSFLLIGAFIAVTGLSPSMTRAGLVSSLSLVAWYVGRAFHPLVLLPFAAMITVVLQPSYAWGDLGWQLSFMAFAGVMLVAPLLQAYFFGNDEPGILRQVLGETVAAHIVTMPLIAGSFGTMSHVAILANLLVVPFVPIAMLGTFVSGLWSLVSLPYAQEISLPVELLLRYMVSVADFLAGLPWVVSEVSVPWWTWPVYYLVLGLLCVYAAKVTRYNLRKGEALI